MIQQAKIDHNAKGEKAPTWAMSALLQKTNRKYFNKHIFHHFLFFFTQIPLPFIMEKILSWINSDVQ